MNSAYLPNPDLPASQYNEDFYRTALTSFIRSTSCTALDLHQQDPMSAYICSVCKDSEIRQRSLSTPLGNRVFVDTMMLFVSQYLQKINFYEQRCKFEQEQIQEAEQWSLDKREHEWANILTKISVKYEEQGFSRSFYEQEWNPSMPAQQEALWSSLLRDWQHHLNLSLQLQKESYLQMQQARQRQILLHNLTATQDYVEQKSLSSEDVFQTLALMGGRWTTVEFERLLRITQLQYKYPILLEIAGKMGRAAHPDGNRQVSSVSGQRTLSRSQAKNDIVGIGIGRDLESILPSEMACFLDPDLQDVFLRKFVTGRLQTFDHKSHILRSARSLRTQSAATQGPVIVCMDTSGSMMGEPSQIALSLMMRLAEMCEQEERECFLITFSVYAQPIDVRRHRSRLMQYFTQTSSGNTDAQRMIDLLNETLQKNYRYMGADVLWISDFRIPFPPAEQFQILERLRESGTRFYGLQIGIAENHWLPYFDEMYHLEDVKLAIL